MSSFAGKTATYVYDSQYRLQSVNYGDSFSETYGYDAMGNRTSLAVVTSGDTGLPTSTPASVPTTVVKGQTITISGTASDTGNPASEVSKVQVSTDNGATWGAAVGRANWTYTWTPTANGTSQVLVKVTDRAGNTYTSTATSVTVNKPVCILRTPPACHDTLQQAYDQAQNGETIRACSLVLFTENLSVARNITVTLNGGYDAGFVSYTGSPTLLKGTIQTLPGGGTLTIGNFSLINQ
jgi:YD repeat-containing protein